MLRAGLWNMPLPGTRAAPGWAAYRERSGAAAAPGPRPLAFLVAYARSGDLTAAMQADDADARPLAWLVRR